MWISKQKYERLVERIEALESEGRAAPVRVCVDREGLLSPWERGIHVVEAINALAKHVGFTWRLVYARPATIEGATVGKTDGR